MDLELMNIDPALDSAQNNELQECERMVLAIAINSSKACFEIVSKLEPLDFSTEANQLVFSAVQDLSNAGKTINIATLIDTLKEKKALEKVGGVAYITHISGYYYTDEGFEGYVEIIFKYSLSRRLDRVMQEIKLSKNNSESIFDLVMEAQQKILNIKTDITSDDAEKVSKIVDRVVKTTFDLMDQKSMITGVTTGYIDIDNLTGGWQAGDFVILAARPSMGKTALALNLAINAAQEGKNVAVFSLEMPKEQLVQRVLSASASIDSKKIRTGQGMTDNDVKKLTATADYVKEYNIVIDDTPGINVLQLQAKIRKLQRDYGIEICFIDYLQLLSGLPNKNENRQSEVATISRQIKKIARELNIPIICLSQLSRSVETREDKRPIMSDLRDSGAIEQDADIIMFLYRKEYYDKKEPTEQSDIENAELIFAKHRNGATGLVLLNFYKNYGRFNNKNN